MGVDISFIMPNGLRTKRNHEENVRSLDQTIKKVERYFRGKKHFVANRYVEKEESDSKYMSDEICDTEYSFSLPFFVDAKFDLHCGYWDIETFFHYCRYFLYNLDNMGRKRVHQREVLFDIARILGYDEGWVCDEYHSWNSGLGEDDGFEEWKQYGDEEDSTIYEYDLSIAKSFDEIQLLDEKSKYHDTFKECRELLAYYQNMFPQYEILTITDVFDCILVAQGYDIYLLNVKTGKLFVDYPIDGCGDCVNGGGIVIYKGKKCALFTCEGKQVTKFRNGGFNWEWKSSRYDDIIITDEATGRKYLSDGSEIS